MILLCNQSRKDSLFSLLVLSTIIRVLPRRVDSATCAERCSVHVASPVNKVAPVRTARPETNPAVIVKSSEVGDSYPNFGWNTVLLHKHLVVKLWRRRNRALARSRGDNKINFYSKLMVLFHHVFVFCSFLSATSRKSEFTLSSSISLPIFSSSLIEKL